MTITAKTLKLTRSVAAAALVLPLSIAAVAAPASASVELADQYTPYPAYGYGFGGYGGYGGSGYGGYGDPSGSTSSTATTGLDTSDASAAQSTGLVQITSTIDYDAGTAAGTGIVIGSDGLVVTNHHVVQGATDIEVTDVTTGETYAADVLGYDAIKDVAVLQVEDASGLGVATTDPGGAGLGDAVTAVGDAGGDGGSLTAAPGTVTDLHEGITVQDEETGDSSRLHNLIEVTSDVVPGDSGGALLDSDGEVVGMNVAASSGSTDVTGYVIPISRVLDVVDQVLAGDDSSGVELGAAAFLGVELSADDSAPTLAGVVADSPAADLGLVAGDTVTSIDGTPLSTADGLRTVVAAQAAGDTVTVTWTDASGTAHTGSATLVAGPVG